jgi:hypothetical protein
MDYANSVSTPTIAGTNRQIGIYNYFLGSDSTKWITNVGTYSGVTIQNLYPGVDAVFYIDNGMPRYDLRLKPGADLSNIQIDLKGQDNLTIDKCGNLVMRTTIGEIEQSQLLAYQMKDGVKEQVACRFKVGLDSAVRFDVGQYDLLAELVIDPLVYSTLLGGDMLDQANGIAVNAGGEAFIVGNTTSNGTYPAGYPTTTGSYQTTNRGNYDAFVTRLNSTGGSLIYSTYIGGLNNDEASAIALDGSGDAYITGWTESRGSYPAGYPTTPNAYQKTNNGSDDAFVTKLNASGSGLIYSTYVGGASNEVAQCIAVDISGNAYITGNSTSSGTYPTGYPTTSGAYQTSNATAQQAFVTKLNSFGSALIYSTYLGGGTEVTSQGIAVDVAGNAYVTGVTLDGYPTTLEAVQPTFGGGDDDAFVTKLNPMGSALIYSTYLGGLGEDIAYAIAVDMSGNAYITGYTFSSLFPTTLGVYQTSNHGSGDVFVSKLNAAGTALIYSTYIGGSDFDIGATIVLDNSLNAYISGWTFSDTPSPFPTTSGAYQTHLVGGDDAFVAELNPFGSSLIYSSYIGGQIQDDARGIALDSSGYCYITGACGNGYPTTQGAFQTLTNAGNKGCAYVSKFAFRSDLAVLQIDSVSSTCGTTSVACLVTNGGALSMTLDSVTISQPFSINTSQFPRELQSDSSFHLQIEFLPHTTGQFTDVLTLYYHTKDGSGHDTTIPISASHSGPPTIGLTLLAYSLQALPSDLIDIPLYLVGSLDQNTSQSIGLKSLSITLTMNTDILSPVDVISNTPSIPKITYQSKGNLVTIQVPIPANFTFTDSTELLTLRLKACLSDTMQTAVTLTSAVFSLTDTLPCFSQSGGAGTCTFALIANCGDSIISRELVQKLDFVIQSIIPNPTDGNLAVTLATSGSESVRYEVFDALGKTTQHGKMSGGKNVLDLTSCKSGSYYLRVTSRGRVESRRIVLQR